jgi:hypothetical protein
MAINNDKEFKSALMGMSPAQLRLAAAGFIDSVLSLSTDLRVAAAVKAAKQAEVSEVELEMQLRSVKAAALASYTQCGKLCDWSSQAGHFVAKAAVRCVEPLTDGGAQSVWEGAMDARMARTCEVIATGEGTENNEAQVQYRIVESLLTS